MIFRYLSKAILAVSVFVCALQATAQSDNVPLRVMNAIRQQYEKTTLLKEGSQAADFTAEKYAGGSVRLSDNRGKVVLLNFWGSWCGPCLRELAPGMLPARLKQFEGNDRFLYLPVAYKDSRESRDKFLATEKGRTDYAYLRTATALDADKEIFNRYATQGVPRLFVIGADGKILLGTLGFVEEELDKVEAIIRQALDCLLYTSPSPRDS